jgi:hypothetical protein
MRKTVTYPVFYTEEGGSPSLAFYDFGLIMGRPSRVELFANLQEEFEDYLEELQKDKITLPMPTDFKKVDISEYSGQLVYVEVAIPEKYEDTAIELK